MVQTISNVYALYWVEAGQPRVLSYDSDEIVKCMQDSEALRKRQRAGEAISHVTFCSENPNSVGLYGCASADSNYHLTHWKRRLDPNIPLGRPSGNLLKAEQ